MYLGIGTVDVSGYLTEESYICRHEGIYSGEFVNGYGETIRTRTGERVTIEATLTDVDDVTAQAIAAALSSGSAQVTYESPGQVTAQMDCIGLTSAIERDRDGLYWTMEIRLSGYVLSCL